MKLTLQDIQRAERNIKGFIRKTPLEKSHTITEMIGQPVYFKYENLQKTGSFKLRGAANKIINLWEEGKTKGVIAASAGNHAQGVAFAATRLGIKAKILMPKGAPITKISATEGYGAEVILEGNTYDDCYNYAIYLAEKENLTYVHAFDDPQVIAGQGTIGLEILEQLPSVKNVIVPIGGGGLMAGVLLAIKESNPNVRVIGVQASGAAAMVQSIKSGLLSATAHVNTIADGIAVKKPGELTYSIIKNYIDDIVTVEEEEISRAILLLLERSKTVVEGAGATTVASLIYSKVPDIKGETVTVLSGGNIDPTTISTLIERGMVKAGRKTFIEVVLQDCPGQLQKLLEVIAANEANVIAVNHDRLSPHIPIKHAKVNLTLETRDLNHGKKILEKLKSLNYDCKISE
ncbi:L-threonine ammonia-lyase [Anaerobranca californiensis DSM 14826]|uniref:L-threonine dehydratase catabolic TdcB n=1 Tax=Anaerobranca californiensis DSM 14826 TaxID=1120989 RepID=A0A1M6PJE8_9FIRM|nr:threonine ammonia-lyase [Anaerobranca californiensis]SHK08055.1 L-threonine ammonia-lyase [Anaerobranca californiensis DSM 14826]